jgi:hypothetical protein
MTYFLEGTLTWDEKPEMYMNRYVAFDRVKISDMEGSGTRTRKAVAALPKKSTTFDLMGIDMKWNDDLEVARKMCSRKDVDVSEHVGKKPKDGWGPYASGNFHDTEYEHLAGGVVRVWDELRLPTPWVYCMMAGSLEATLRYEGGRFVEADHHNKGSRRMVGLVAPGFNVSKVWSSYEF